MMWLPPKSPRHALGLTRNYGLARYNRSPLSRERRSQLFGINPSAPAARQLPRRLARRASLVALGLDRAVAKRVNDSDHASSSIAHESYLSRGGNRTISPASAWSSAFIR
jgi:hypothetical protein